MVEDTGISVVIVEDQEIARVGLKVILEANYGIKVVGVAQDGQEAVATALALKPNVVLMDIGLPVLNGIEATKQIKTDSPDQRIIMLTSHDDDRHVFAALSAGADGYCLKEAPSQQLVMAIKAVAEGVAWLDPGIAGRVLRSIGTGGKDREDEKANPASTLSSRELDVLRLVVDGSTNQEIADKLVLSVETVKTHMRHIMEKLAVSDRTQAAVKAMREGLI
ncbi:response regulator transcription factor [Candidatus Obscuribacterales bacterium]|nr:response regulator transcription factor [Candidatus Obscuribacterales bacterium]MBX3153919.1 response regulator transcription factor [Candidatus Obscuribacterales bacterium]